MLRDREFRARDKKVHKMTRDGLVERNETTGEEQRISQRGQDFQMRKAEQNNHNLSGQAAPAGHSRRQRYSPQRDTPIHPGEPEAAPSANQPDTSGSLWDTVRPAPQSHVPSEGQRSPAYQQKSAQQEHPADTVPTEGPNCPDSGRSPQERAGAPVPSPAPTGRNTPSTPHSDWEQIVSVSGWSRLQFGEASRPAEHAPGIRQHDTRYIGKFAADKEGTQPGPPTFPADTAGQKPAGPTLQFAADELPPDALGKKLTDVRRKAERAGGKLEKAREKLPTHRRIRVQNSAREDTGKVRRSLHFEKEVKTRRQHVKGPLPLRPVKAAANAAVRFGHRKLYEVEEDNIAVKAAHRTEIATESLGRTAYRFHKTRPYRRIAKLQHKAMQADVKLAYRHALHDHPQLKSNLLSRMVQKHKIKRQYAKAARDARKAAVRAKKTGDALSRTVGAVGSLIRQHPVAASVVALSILVLSILVLFILMSMFSSCSAMAGGGFSSVLLSTYTAEDRDIDDAELAYMGWETDLRFQIDEAESDHPGFDEYRYDLDQIGHDPFALMAYLTAKYHNFTFAGVEADLLEIFAAQYTLEFMEEIEVRYRTEYYYDEDGERHSRQVPYDWHILNVNLTTRPFADILSERMDADQQEHHNLLMDTLGNRQYTLSPFDFDWRPYISCPYGWRIHPISGARDNHPAVDIAVAEGTAIRAAHDGTVTTATVHSSYGNYIALDRGDGVVTKYAHCSVLLVSVGQEVKQGDIIAKVGSTGVSTGPHLHFEVLVNGQHLNPLYFSETN